MNSVRLGCILEQQKPFMTRRPGRDAYDCPYKKTPLHFMSGRLSSPKGDVDMQGHNQIVAAN